MKYLVRPVTQADMAHVAEHMRAADRAEVLAATGHTPREALDFSAAASRDTFCGLADGVPVLIAGTARPYMLGTEGMPWMLATDDLYAHAKPFLRRCRPYMRQLRREYSYLWNFVDARNVEAVQWLGWLGFDVHPPAPYGVAGLEFHMFDMRGD